MAKSKKPKKHITPEKCPPVDKTVWPNEDMPEKSDKKKKDK